MTAAAGPGAMHPNLDVLRATAVLLVLASHLVMVLGYLDQPLLAAWGIRQLAQLGVLLFFIHTSIVLMMSLDRLGPSSRALRFYVRRIFRIYPLAAAAVLVAVAAGIPPHFEATYEAPTRAVVVHNLLLAQNLFGSPDVLGPMWSLPYEVQMYVVLPLVFLAAARLRGYNAALALMACGFVIWYAELQLARRLEYKPLLTYAPWFFMGIGASVLFRRVRPWLSPWVFLASLAGIILAQALAHRFVTDHREGWASWAAGLAFALVVPHCRAIHWQWVQRASHAVATYSYGIYLAHVPIMWLAFQQLADRAWPVQALTFLTLIVVVPPMLYHGIEAPLIRVGARLADGFAARRNVTTVLAQ